MLAPTYLAVFAGEDDADITEEGFLRGQTNSDEEVPAGANVGVCINLVDLESITEEGTQLAVALKEGITVDGPGGSPVGSIVAECANAEIAQGWAGAVRSQWECAGAVEVPPRVPRSKQPQPKPVVEAPAPQAAPAAAKPASTQPSPASGSTSARFGSMMGSLRNLMVSGGKEPEPVRLDSEYTATDAWVGRADLAHPKTGKKHWRDATGKHEAVVLHGWLTKRNKSGLAKAGGLVAEKERYFVLTPTALCYFPSAETAGVGLEGYMTGRAEGTTTGLLGKTGARLPLESVCEVRVLGPNGKPVGRGSAAGAKARRARDVEDGDEEGGGGRAAAADASVGASAASGTGGVALFEIDFADAVLTCNAHNGPCRTTWVEATRKWAGIRKKAVDEDMFAIGECKEEREWLTVLWWIAGASRV